MDKKKKILLIVNRSAGKMRSKLRVVDIIDLFRDEEHVTTVFTTRKKGDATEIVKAHANEYDAVVCCGGDGTLNEVVTGLMEIKSETPIGYIPAGTTNDTAKTLKIPTRIKKAVALILNGEPVAHDIGFLNECKYFSYIASFGAFTKVSYATPQWLKKQVGHFAYVLDGIKRVAEIKPYKVKVKTENFEVEDEFVFGCVTNATSVGGVLKISGDEVSLNDGKFEVLLIRNPRNPEQLSKIIYGLTNQKYDARYVLFLHADEISFQFEKETEWTVDGEFAGSLEEVHIKNLQNAVKIIR